MWLIKAGLTVLLKSNYITYSPQTSLVKDINLINKYSRTSVARTLMARLPWLFQTCS